MCPEVLWRDWFSLALWYVSSEQWIMADEFWERHVMILGPVVMNMSHFSPENVHETCFTAQYVIHLDIQISLFVFSVIVCPFMIVGVSMGASKLEGYGYNQ